MQIPSPTTAAPQTAAATLTPAQLQVVEAVRVGGGPLLVVGGPGTGKTHTLVECAATALASGLGGSEVLLLTTTRPLAQKLRNDLMRRIGGAQVAPRVMTAHALAHAIVTDHPTPGEPLWNLLTAPEQEFRLRELLSRHDTAGWSEDLRRAAGTRAFAAEVRAAVARVRQLGLDPEDVADLGLSAGRGEWVALAGFMGEYLDVVDATFEMDYAELVHRARLRLLDPQLLAEVVQATPLILVDDLVELDPSQVQLLADLVAGGSRLVAFADPSTSVYGFRGAGGLALGQFDDIFGAAASTGRIDLGEDQWRARRVSSALAALATRLPRNDRQLVPEPSAQAPAGQVHVRVLDSPGAEIDHIVEQVRRAHLAGGIAWHDMAVITRSHRGGLLPIARALTTAGVPVQVAAGDTALGQAPAVRPLLLALRAVIGLRAPGGTAGPSPEEGTEPSGTAPPTATSPEDAVELLRSPLGGLDSLEVRRLGRQLRAQDPDAGLSSGEWFARALDDILLLSDLPGEPARKALELAQRLERARHVLAEGGDASAVLWALWESTAWAARAERDALAGGDAAPAANRDLDAVRALFDLAARDTQLVGVRSVRQLLDELVTHQIAADTAREADLARRGVELLTAHRAKGRRWRYVVVAQLQEGTWPATRRRGTVLDVDRLTPGGLAEAEPYSRLIDAERRSFLLACSRAAEQLLVTAAQGHEGEGDQASRFLSELGCDVEVVHGRPTHPLTMPAMVARLRRVVVDAEASPGLRQAAATRLARLAQSRDRHGRPLARGADPETWWGSHDQTRPGVPTEPADEPLVLSATDVAGLQDCPRRWFLSRRVNAEAGRGTAASLGSVIHALVGHAATDNLDREQLHGHLDQVWEQIPFEAAWLSASERATAQDSLDRYLAWVGPRGSRLLGTEVKFRTTVEVAGERVVLKGSVDRLELDDEDRLRVVDFKTGRSKMTAAEAATDVQLGFYQLAATAGAFEELAPGVTASAGAELVYLRRGEDFPEVLRQDSLDQEPRPPQDGEGEYPSFIHAAIGQAVETIRAERFEAQASTKCMFCQFRTSCPTLGQAPQVGR
ncbi:PD-(D/E)XK nuclease family protein [Propionibacteriaceae bacterium Y1923]